MKRWWMVWAALAASSCASERRYETTIPGSSVTDFDRGPTRSPQRGEGSPVGDQGQIGPPTPSGDDPEGAR